MMTELQKFKCHKVVSAQAMTFGKYHWYKHGKSADSESVDDEGYLVVYNENTPDHYESWSPKKQFEEGYSLILDSKEPTGIMKYFEFKHLPPHLQSISQPIGDLASFMNHALPDGPEKSAGLRKLLEAKDCFVRANLK